MGFKGREEWLKELRRELELEVESNAEMMVHSMPVERRPEEFVAPVNEEMRKVGAMGIEPKRGECSGCERRDDWRRLRRWRIRYWNGGLLSRSLLFGVDRDIKNKIARPTQQERRITKLGHRSPYTFSESLKFFKRDRRNPYAVLRQPSRYEWEAKTPKFLDKAH